MKILFVVLRFTAADNSLFCCTLMVALLWSIAGGGGRLCIGAGIPADEAGRVAPFVGDNEVYETAVTSKFDFLSDAALYARSFLLCCNNAGDAL